MEGRHGCESASGGAGPLSPKNQPHRPAVWSGHPASQAGEAVRLFLSPWGRTFPSTQQPGPVRGRQLLSGPLAWGEVTALPPPQPLPEWTAVQAGGGLVAFLTCGGTVRPRGLPAPRPPGWGQAPGPPLHRQPRPHPLCSGAGGAGPQMSQLPDTAPSPGLGFPGRLHWRQMALGRA